MRTSIIALSVIMLIGCKSRINQENESVNKLEILESDSLQSKTYINPMSVIFANKAKPDTMYLKLDNDNLSIVSTGKVFKNNKLYFDIKPGVEIEKVYIQPSGDDFIVFYEFSDAEGAGSYSKRISAKENKSIWETPIHAFNLANPALVGDYAYLSTMGFVGKLNMNDGEYIWKFEDIDKKYESFNEPIFLKDSVVLFTRKVDPMIADSILVDDKNGKVIKID